MKPMIGNCLLSNIPREHVTPSGIIVPLDAEERSFLKGKVMEVGRERTSNDCRVTIPPEIKQGDTVYYSNDKITEYKINGETFFMTPIQSIVYFENDDTGIKAMSNQVLVEPLDNGETITTTGIIIQNKKRHNIQVKGRVVSVGRETAPNSEHVYESPVNVGDIVHYKKYHETTLDAKADSGTNLIMLPYSSILMYQGK